MSKKGTDVIYMPGVEENYIKEFTAQVVKAKNGWVALDRTAFYAMGGGQPTDTGTMSWTSEDGTEHRLTIKEVQKKSEVRHFVEGGELPPQGAEVKCQLDWDRRHAHMRMHTAQHLISGVVYDLFKARTVGNQIHAEFSRIDFEPAHFSKEDLETIAARCHELIAEGLGVKIYDEDRDSVEARVDPIRSSMDMIPQFIKNLRMVDIGEGRDLCPCAGTHVRSLEEVKGIVIKRRENKGKDRERIVYELAE
jgi:misacylated tRNA(Ala) deacylase